MYRNRLVVFVCEYSEYTIGTRALDYESNIEPSRMFPLVT